MKRFVNFGTMPEIAGTILLAVAAMVIVNRLLPAVGAGKVKSLVSGV